MRFPGVASTAGVTFLDEEDWRDWQGRNLCTNCSLREERDGRETNVAINCRRLSRMQRILCLLSSVFFSPGSCVSLQSFRLLFSTVSSSFCPSRNFIRETKCAVKTMTEETKESIKRKNHSLFFDARFNFRSQNSFPSILRLLFFNTQSCVSSSSLLQQEEDKKRRKKTQQKETFVPCVYFSFRHKKLITM